MADVLDGRELVLNSLLCFVMSKFTSLGIEKVRSIAYDFYNGDQVSVAKKQLLDDVEKRGLSTHLSRYPDRHGDKKMANEVKDIAGIITDLDEHNVVNSLPIYVTDNTERIPSIKLEDGDLAFLLAKIDKLEGHLVQLQQTVYASSSSKAVNNNSYAATVTRPQQPPSSISAIATGSSAAVSAGPSGTVTNPSYGRKSTVPLRRQDTRKARPPRSADFDVAGDNTIGRSAASASATAKPRVSQHGRSDRWADVMAEQSASEYRSDHDDSSDFELVTNRRKRLRLQRQSADQRPGGAVTSQSAISSAGVTVPRSRSTAAAQNHSVRGNGSGDQQPRTARQSRRQPLVIGKSTNSSNIQAARPFKLVLCVDNVSLSYNEDQLADFVSSLGVRVFTCHEVRPRLSYYQRNNFLDPDHRTFRLCINKVDKNLLLNADVLPADITISRWHFKDKTTTLAENDLAQPHSNAVTEIVADTVPKTVTSDDRRGFTTVVASIDAVGADIVGNSEVTADESVAIVDIMDDTLTVSPGHPVAAGTPDDD